MYNNYTKHNRYKPKPKLIRSEYLLHQVRRHWVKSIAIIAIGSVISQKDLSIDMSFNARPSQQNTSINANTVAFQPMPARRKNERSSRKEETRNVSQKTYWKPLENHQRTAQAPPSSNKNVSQNKRSKRTDDNLANTYDNLDFDRSNYADPAKAAKRKKQLAYVKKYAEIAKKEKDKYGIPASIKLAQGLLESNVGESRLAVHNNNHFGMKCFSRTCKKGHCSNFTDDSHKDFFRKYKNVWESYRAHSILLQNNRYKHLKNLKSSDYKGWAYGLKKAGYATDKNYAPKIIGLIEDLKLYKYD